MITLNKKHFPTQRLFYSPDWVGDGSYAIKREFVANPHWIAAVIDRRMDAEHFRNIKSLKDSEFRATFMLNNLKIYQRTKWFYHDECYYAEDSVAKSSKRECRVYINNDDNECILFDSLYLKILETIKDIDTLLYSGLDENRMVGYPAINIAKRKQDARFLIMPINSFDLAVPSVLFSQFAKKRFW